MSALMLGGFAVAALLAWAAFALVWARRKDDKILVLLGVVNRVHGTAFPASREANFLNCVHHRSLSHGSLFFDLSSGKMALVRSEDDIQVLPIGAMLKWEPLWDVPGARGRTYVLRVTLADPLRPVFEVNLGGPEQLEGWNARVGMIARKAASHERLRDRSESSVGSEGATEPDHQGQPVGSPSSSKLEVS